MLKRVLLFVLILGSFSALVIAQQTQIIPAENEQVDPNFNISFPPPVYTLFGEVEIQGSVALPNMTNYFVEFRPLILEDTTAEGERPWFPATLPSSTPVIDGVVGIWNTAIAPDGLYEMRLTVNTTTGTPQFFLVSPIRVDKESPLIEMIQPIVVQASPTPLQFERPTLAPTPTAFDPTPRATALVDANVRQGDSTEYNVVGFLREGDSAEILGVSSRGTGWYYILLQDGRRGFIAGSIVNTSGSLRGLPFVDPPPPPFTPTPIPTATPVTSANLYISNIRLEPAQPRCLERFTIFVTISNNGTGATTRSGSIAVNDVNIRTNSTEGSTVGGFPVIQPGESFTGFMELTISTFYDEAHRVNIQIDSLGEVPETNENDNFGAVQYTLAKASCP